MESRITVTLVERLGEDNENAVEKSISFSQDYLHLEDNVLPTFESALKGFGFVMDGKHLEIVEDES
jgi:hypothetical protein